jgi:hypothetical protein
VGNLSAAEYREHLRHVWRESASLGVTPAKYLDQLADIALKAQRDGKTLSASASGGTSVAFLVFQNFDPAKVVELIDVLRAPCDEVSLSLALGVLAAARPGIRSFQSDFRRLQV